MRTAAIISLLAAVAAAVPAVEVVSREASAATLGDVIDAVKRVFVTGGEKATSTVPNVWQRATGGKVTTPDARWDNTNIDDGVGSGSDSYTMHWGSGHVSEGWPSKSKWVSFRNMFDNNKNNMFGSCSWMGVPNNSGPEIGAIWDGIQQVASETGVDHRFILAVILQESGGCVRVHTTNYGVRNPGLMQDHNGPTSCNDNGWVQNPCPTPSIFAMIREGTAGTNDGDGLAQCINQGGYNGEDTINFYRAARIYNSGSVASINRLECGIATHCYASDIANRLTGWVSAAHNCPCDDNYASCGCPN